MKRSLSIAAIVMGLTWLISTGVLLFYIADLAPLWALLIAFVAMDGAFGLLLALLITTNTRRAWPLDPYAQTTDELHKAIMLPDGRAYGRRAQDDRNVVDRLSDILEEEAARRPQSERTPHWAIEIATEHARASQTVADTPQEEM